MRIKVNNKIIGDRSPVFVIAEIGTNHNGKLNLAMKMVDEAAKAGADAVKLQIVNVNESYVSASPSYDIFKKINLRFDALEKLKKASEEKGLVFFATAGDVSSLATIARLRIPIIKISSGCMTNVVLIRKIARTGLPIVMSTGMSYLYEVRETVAELEKHGARKIAILHCVSSYPARHEELNMNAIKVLQHTFKYPVGYSDHAQGNSASLVAVAIGARLIEKHFTLDKRLRGPDHRFSSDPRDLKDLVEGIRDIEKMMGREIKRPSKSEMASRNKLRRFLVFTRDLTNGATITKEDIGIKRFPGKRGLPPKWYDSIIGKRIVKDVGKDEPVRLSLIKQ